MRLFVDLDPAVLNEQVQWTVGRTLSAILILLLAVSSRSRMNTVPNEHLQANDMGRKMWQPVRKER